MREHDTCDSRGQTLPREQLKNFDGSLICPECLERKTVLCSHCGTRIWKDENAGTEGTPLCQHCYDNYYMACTHCGRVIHEDDAYYLSEDSDTEDQFSDLRALIVRLYQEAGFPEPQITRLSELGAKTLTNRLSSLELPYRIKQSKGSCVLESIPDN